MSPAWPGLAAHWQLDPSIAFLNHGSFGACPRAVLREQQRLRELMESQPVRFFVRWLDGALIEARRELAAFVGADDEGLAFVPNATCGVNTVLRSLEFQPGDELVTTDHEYRACHNALEFVARRAGAKVVVAPIPFPIESPAEAVAAILSRVTERTRLALFDHVTSQTGLVLPAELIVRELSSRGVDSLVDGAHAPGMLPVNLERMGAAYYTANCHKWLCAPKGAAFLYARADRRDALHPLAISHGYDWPGADRSRFRLEFDWTGTDDPTAYLCVPVALRTLQEMLPDGWPGLMRRNRQLALDGRRLIGEVLGIARPPCPDEMVGSMAALPIPDGSPEPPRSFLYTDPLQDALLERHGIEVPIVPWPSPPKRLLRISAQLYNEREQFEKLASTLGELLT